MQVNNKDFAIVSGLVAIIVLIGFITIKYDFRNATVRDLNEMDERLVRIETKIDHLLKKSD
jgi:hypothetical protein